MNPAYVCLKSAKQYLELLLMQLTDRMSFPPLRKPRIRTLLIGAGENAARVSAALACELESGYEIVTQIRNVAEAFLQAGASWSRLCSLYEADHIIIAMDGLELTRAKRWLAQLAHESVPFSVSPPINPLPVAGMTAQYFDHHGIILMTRPSLAG